MVLLFFSVRILFKWLTCVLCDRESYDRDHECIPPLHGGRMIHLSKKSNVLDLPYFPT